MSFQTTLIALSLTLLASFAAPSTATFAAGDDDKKASVEYFFPSENVMKDVDATLAKAKANNKLAVFILGADWCHDSIGLVERFDNPAMKKILDDSYEITLIDVAFFEHGLDVVKRFGQPTIFATPTVMIIDPVSEQLVNGHNMHQFKDAEAMGLEKTISYFDTMRSQDAQTLAISGNGNADLTKLLDGISTFEASQAIRIESGFQQMVPYLKIAKDKRPKKFMALWMELRPLRYGIADTVAALRKQALERTAAGETNITLSYPEYKAFSWE